jgi:thioredoxin reductase
MNKQFLPVAVIGAGPVGLAAVAHLIARGETPIVFEAGESVGANLLKWGHVRVFSPWSYSMDTASTKLLEASGWQAPDPEGYPTGQELVRDYLQPFADLPAVKPALRLSTKVVAISRQGFDKMKSEGRENAPFVLRVQKTNGEEEEILAKAVIDASGTYANPNPLGSSGIPAMGEKALADHIFYAIPDVLGKDQARYAGKRVLVVGSGHSAFNALLDLVQLKADYPKTEITWAIRKTDTGQMYGGASNDKLPKRASLGQHLAHLVERGLVNLVTGFKVARLTATNEGIVVADQDRTLPTVDEIIATTGFRSDLSLFQELRVKLDEWVDSPQALAPLIDPNVHSCGSVPPHGYEELKHPEKDFYVVGMKSYGRAPTFLMLTGFEQVRSVVSAIAGDMEAAREVNLILPETGVCGTKSKPANLEGKKELAVVGSAGGSVCCG